MSIAWKRIEPTKVDKVGWRTIVTKTFQMPDGAVETYGTMANEGARCIATIALTTDQQVIVARQFRPGPEKIMDELPGGGVESHDTDLEAAARRELIEETGYAPGQMTYLGQVFKDAYTNASWHFFLATDCVSHAGGAQPDATEHIEVTLISIQQLLENARNGRMTDTEAVFLAYDTLRELTQSSSGALQ